MFGILLVLLEISSDKDSRDSVDCPLDSFNGVTVGGVFSSMKLFNGVCSSLPRGDVLKFPPKNKKYVNYRFQDPEG